MSKSKICQLAKYHTLQHSAVFYVNVQMSQFSPWALQTQLSKMSKDKIIINTYNVVLSGTKIKTTLQVFPEQRKIYLVKI